jgi:dTDP-4-dehydrorhamnose reductase
VAGVRILVTGASGLLGINLALEAAKVHTVSGLVNQRLFYTNAFEVLQADLLTPGELERVLDQARPDWVIHCAALAIVDECEAQPERARQLNSILPARLAAALVGRGGARLLHISTDAVFDGQRGGYTEEDIPSPLSVYAKTKLEGERVVLGINPQALVARVNLFGWSITGKRSLAEFFFNNLSAGKNVSGFVDVYFCPLLANHLAGLLLEMLEQDLTGLYHVVSRECISKYEFGVRLARRFGLDDRLIHPTQMAQALKDTSNLKAVRSPRLTLSSAKLTAALGKMPPGIDTGLDGLYQLFSQGYPELIQRLGGVFP